MDVLVPITMKNAAKCDKQCELQNRESSDFRTQLAPCGVTRRHAWSSVLLSHHLNLNVRDTLLLPNMKALRSCERPSGRTQCSSHIAYNVNSLGAEAARRQLPVLGHTNLGTVSGLRWDHPLNLSISLSGGKETN